jgi:hypothetical protein
MRWLSGFAVIVLLITGCGSKKTEESGFSRVEGSVHRPVEGAVVDVYRPGEDIRGPPFTQLGPLGSEGEFAIELPSGEYTLVARRRESGEKTGPVREGDLKTDPLRIRVEGGEPLNINLLAYAKEGNPKERFGEQEAEWKASISGRILDPEQKPLGGLRVHVYDHVQMSERPKYVSARTGPDGSYEVKLPQGGTYYLCARDQYGGPPKVGDLYGRYDQGTVDPSAVIVPEGTALKDIDITVHTVW